MKKVFAKILIILVLAGIIGGSLITYTKRGAQTYDILKKDMRAALLYVLDARDDTSDLDPYVQTPAQEFAGLYNSGNIIGTGQDVDSDTLQERLNYYISDKDNLWNE